MQKEKPSAVPQQLLGQTFVYDQLETGEGSSLYTLSFQESGFSLCKDGGAGIVAFGSVQEDPEGGLIFSDQAGEFTGRYTGGSFREPRLTLSFSGAEMTMVPATETTEYVYQSYLGVYEGTLEGKTALLILERWKEFYLCLDGSLTRGSYDIYSDGVLKLSPYQGKSIEASVEVPEGQPFDIDNLTISLDTGSLRTARPEEIYEAAHAMGTYTLSVYGQNVFTIRGVDGFLKSFGFLDGGNGVYFPRKITGEAETGDGFPVPYTRDGDILRFPDTTPLLPRSGNLDEESGLGRYWNAGTNLEFICRKETADPSEGIRFVEHTLPIGVSGGNFPDSVRGLEQAMPSVGTARPLVLLVDFPDFHRPRHVTAEGMENALFSLEDPNSLASFYYRSSYGNLIIDGTVLDWYRTRRDRDSYDSDYEIMAEAIGYHLDQGVDLSSFDSDGDGAIDSLYVLWAGNLSGREGIWNAAYRSGWNSSPEEWEKKVSGYIFVPGSTVWSLVPPLQCNTNSLIHETGHLLGLNDYYSYDTSPRSGYTGGALEGGLAGMDMMDANIGDHNIFSKWLLGWAEPMTLDWEEIRHLNGETIRISPSGLAPEGVFVKLKPTDTLYTELLVIEAVSPAGNAAEYSRLSRPVVRILHVDASEAPEGMQGNWRGYGFRYDNSYTTTKFISALEADGEDSFLNYLPVPGGIKPSYSEQDYFHAGDVIGPNTYPNTNGYDEAGNATVPTGLEIEIQEIEEDGTAVIRLWYREAEDRVSLLSVSPEPRIVPYIEPVWVPTGTRELVFTYDREISSQALEKIVVCRDQQVLKGVRLSVEGACLTVTLPEGMEHETGVTVVIPHGILHSTENPDIVNNSNGIYGFAAQ